MQHYSARQLHDYLSQSGSDPLLLDVREPWEFEYCHINGSILIPMGKLPDKMNELDPQRETVVICHHGIRSRHMGYYMEQAGFKNIVNLDGGVERWADEVEPTMKRY